MAVYKYLRESNRAVSVELQAPVAHQLPIAACGTYDELEGDGVGRGVIVF